MAAAADPLTPTRFLTFSDADLLAIGFSRQKARYGRALAVAVETRTLDLDELAALDDAYLLMVLGRPDLWPLGDIALATAVGEVKGLGHRPGQEEMAAIGEAWRPWRSVAARLFWHDYLARRGRSG